MKKALFALIKWSMFRAVGDIETDGDHLTVSVTYKARLYSPVLWVLFALLAVLHLGEALWEVCVECKDLCVNAGQTRFTATYKKSVSKWRRKYAAWRLIYGGNF
jgi:hypothetical protein